MHDNNNKKKYDSVPASVLKESTPFLHRHANLFQQSSALMRFCFNLEKSLTTGGFTVFITFRSISRDNLRYVTRISSITLKRHVDLARTKCCEPEYR